MTAILWPMLRRAFVCQRLEHHISSKYILILYWYYYFFIMYIELLILTFRKISSLNIFINFEDIIQIELRFISFILMQLFFKLKCYDIFYYDILNHGNKLIYYETRLSWKKKLNKLILRRNSMIILKNSYREKY